MSMVPLFIAYLIGVGPALLWAVVAAAAALLLWLSGLLMHLEPSFVNPAAATCFARIALIALATALGVAARRATDRRMTEVHAARQLAEAASQAKSDFLANMSHELRTPLNAVLGYTGTLLMRLPGPLTQDQESQLTVIRGSAQHLLSLINDILDLAKIESGRMELRAETIDCQRVLDDVAATLKPLAEQKHLEVRIETPVESFSLQVDRRAITQIVLNLAINAIKFTEQGEVRLGLHAVLHEGRPQLEFSVTDTGVGIRAEDQPRLFEAFSQLDHAHDGTGLGLHLSQRFARLIGGQILFESEYGKGSRFALRLPLAG
jgi:signal transduction histidine kinase